MVKVMHLVDPKMLQQMSIPANPVHRTIATLDQDMQAVLDRQDLSDDDKVRHYNQILQRYLEYHDRLKSTAAPSSLRDATSNNMEQEVLTLVPDKWKHKAHTILERIKHQPNMSWNERGEFVYNGEVVKGSNIADLVNDVVRHRKTFHPHGWQEFARALRQGNVPQDLIGNRKRWDWMHRESATSDAFSTAEESSPERKSRRPKDKTPARHRSMSKKLIKREPLSVKKEIKWEPYP